MKWIIGLDLLGRCAGALRFAAWFRSTSREADGERFVAVHVLEEGRLLVVLRYQHLEDVLESARAPARSMIAKEGASEAVGSTGIEMAAWAPVPVAIVPAR